MINRFIDAMQLLKDGITETKMKILNDCIEPKNIKQISKDVDIDYSITHRHVINLEKKGYIKISKPKRNERGKPRKVCLTQKTILILQGIKK